MKKIVLLLFSAFLVLPAFAQNAPIDFEAGGNGADWTWTVFENDTNPPLEIIANPDMSGANTSATVAKFTALSTGNPWVGCETMHGADIGTFTIDASNSTIKIMVWKPVISDVGIKLVDAGNGSLGEIKIPNTTTNQWEEITFDFSAHMGMTYDQIVVFPDFLERAQDNIIYFDNITFGEGTTVSEPMTAAPDPTNDPATVISMFSNVYTDVPVDTWQTSWSAATLEDIQIQGNDTKKYSGLDFVGIESTTTTIDASAMTHIHLDMWSPNATFFAIKLVDFGADGAFGGGDDTEHQIDIPNPAQGQWVGLDLPLADFAGLASRSNLAQYILVGQPTGSSTIYIDNVYFYEGTTSSEPMTAAPDPTVDPANVISMFSGVYTDVTVDTWRTDWSAGDLEDIQIQGNDTKKYTNMDFIGVETTTSTIDASAMTHFHLDMWSPDATLFAIKLVDFGADGAFGGGDDTEHQIDIPNPAQGQWVGLDLPLADFAGLLSTEHMAQYIFVAQPTGMATVYIDNVYFYQATTIGEPMTAAPDPTVDPANVISMFSGVYTDVPVDTWRTDWSAADLEDIQIQGNDTKKYTNLDFVGIETTTSTIDASGMTHFHLDMWSPNATLFAIKLVDFGADGAFGGGDDTEHQIDIPNPALGEWVSLDLPLTDFTGLASAEHMAQYIFVGQPTGTSTVYVDNVYFYTDQVSVSSFEENNVELFPNPVQSNFTIRTDRNIEEVQVYNVLGSLVMRERVLDQNPTFDIAHLVNGTYFVVATIEGETMVTRLIKN